MNFDKEDLLKIRGMFFKAIIDAILIVDQDGCLLKTNPAFDKLLGYKEGELEGRMFTSIVHKKAKIQRLTSPIKIHHFLRSTKIPIEMELMNKEGVSVPIRFRSLIIRDDKGKVVEAIGMAEDLGENKRGKELEQKVWETQENLQNVLANSGDAILVCDANGRITIANDALVQMLRYQEDEIVGEHLTELSPCEGSFTTTTGEEVTITNEYNNYQIEKANELFERGKVTNYELYFIRKDGKIIPIEATISVLKDQKGKVRGSIALCRDITERRKAEEKLRKLTHNLGERVKELSCLSSIFKLIEKQDISLGKLLKEIVNLIPPAWQYPEITCARIIMEDQVYKTDNFAETIWKQACDIITHGNRKGTLEICYLEERPESDEGPFLKEESTLTKVIAGKLGRIFEHNLAEASLKRSEERYYNLIEFAHVGIIVTEKGKITQVNKRAEEIYGYSRDELIGKSPGILTLEKYKKQHREMLDELLSSGKAKKMIFEEEGVRKDGSLFPVEISFNLTIKGENTVIAVMRDITDRKRAEEEVRKTRDYLDNVIESSLDCIVVSDHTGYVTRANSSFLKLLCYREEEIIGKNMSELGVLEEGTYESTTGESLRIGSELFNETEKAISKLHKEGKILNWESCLVRKDKKVVPVEVSIVYLYNEKGDITGAVGISRDITERRKIEKEIKEGKDFLENIFKNSADGIMITDPKGFIIMVNKATEKMLSYSQDELIGKHVVEFSPKEEKYQEKGKKMLAKLRGEGTITGIELALIRKDGILVNIEVNSSLLKDNEDNTTGIVAIIRDITERKKIQEMEMRNAFISNISHEFRTPLTLSIGPLEGLLSGENGIIGKEVKDQIGLALRNNRRLLKLVNQLLEFTCLESDSKNLRYYRKDINQFLSAVVDTFIFLAKKKDIKLNFTPGEDIEHVYIDPGKLEKVFFNIIGNAFKYTPRGGSINIDVEKNEEGVDDDFIKISVIDTGIGIKKEDLPHIFERFQQASSSSSRRHEGTGIGLSLAKELIELQGGKIKVESKYGRGSTFTIYLPFGKEHINDQCQVKEDMDEIMATQKEIELSDVGYDEVKIREEEPTGERPLILFIDDNPDVRRYVTGILSKQYDVITAEDGLKGIEKLKEYIPDLIISDIMMPEMDGYEFCKAIKSNPELRYIPLIFLTAKADITFKIEGLEEGADDYIVKPFNSLELLARVNSLLRIRDLMRKSAAQEKKIINLTQRLQGKYCYGNIIGNSLPMRKIYQLLEAIKESDSTVLITGETGTGKELIANGIHYNNSQRKDGPMISVNCGAIPRELMEREFFGHIKGAYTGAVESKKGYFEEADGGALFLDEIGEMDRDMQVKLLRVLERGEITRVGDSSPTKVDVRLIVATNKDLAAEVRKGNFREDLYYRIYVIPIHVPPLRERREDIPLLIEHFLRNFQSKHKTKIPPLSEKEMSLFTNYSYPGNVRELEYIIERFCLLGSSAGNLFSALSKGSNKLSADFSYDEILSSTSPLKEARVLTERDIIIHTLKICNNNYDETAKKLNICLSSLYRKMKECGLNG